MYINYDYYRIFYYVAKCRNFTQAARLLMNSQPNVTRAIKNLENELGCRLFIRSNRGVTLTPEGEKLFVRVSAAVEQLQAGEEELAKDRSLQSGIVSIGASDTALHLLLLPVLKKFHQNYPGIRIRISSYSVPRAITALKNGLVDFAVISTPAEIPKPLQATSLLHFQDVLLCGPSYSFLSEKKWHLKELLSYPLITLGKDTKTYEFFSAFFLQHGCSLNPDLEVTAIGQILPMIENGLGIGFLPKSFVEQDLESRKIFQIPLEETIPERGICLVNNSSRSPGIAARELEHFLSK